MNKLVFVTLLIIVAIVSAEPPRFRKNQRGNFKSFARQEETPSTTSENPIVEDASTTAAPTNGDGPYPASGWKPAGRLLALPARTSFNRFVARPAKQQEESAGYQYPKPTQTYGPPEEEATTTETNEEATTTDIPADEATTTNPDTEGIDVAAEDTVPAEINDASGLYYVQLPNGYIQQVVYIPTQSVNNAVKQESALLLAQPAFLGSAPQSFSYTSQFIKNF